MSEVTQILEAIDHGDARAADQLLPLVCEELRRLAARKMAHEATKLNKLMAREHLNRGPVLIG